MHDIIRVDHLSKRFGEVQAVQDLSFRVKEGELFAFLGVNGAGKSTTINILCGQLAKDGGSVEIDGADPDRDPDRVRRELGVVFQNSVLDGALSVRDNLQSRAALYGIRGAAFAKRLAELAQLLDFWDILDRPVGRLSGGQRRRIDIARALLHRPKILIFDEPTTGLDPQTRRLLWDVVTELRRKEKLTVFLTTHSYGGGRGRRLRDPAGQRPGRRRGHAAGTEKHLCRRSHHAVRRGRGRRPGARAQVCPGAGRLAHRGGKHRRGDEADFGAARAVHGL
ncbi:MAG: ABC transporter ATP-binding protein [Oscillospiraceae bacterium]